MLAALVAGCQSAPVPLLGASTPPPAPRGTLVAADYEYPDTLDPIHGTTLADLRVSSLLYDPAWTLAPDLAPEPRLLKEVPTAADRAVRLTPDGLGMTVDLRLRPGLRWSDGVPITADDLIFTVEAICSDAHPGRDRSGFDHIASQERRSATEVIWHFGPRPRGACGLPADLGSGVFPAYELLGPRLRLLPAHRLASLAPAAWAGDPYFQKPDVVSGPFRPASVVAGSLIDLAANPEYAAGRDHGPRLAGLTWRFYLGKEAEIAGLQSGEADLGFHLLPADRPELSGIRGSQVVARPTLQGELLGVNHGGRFASDPALAAALATAVDRKALDETAFGGEAALTAGLFPAAMKEYTVPARPAGSAPAKAALDADGWKPGADGVRVKGGVRLSFSLVTVCDSFPRQLEQAELVRQWAAVGAQAIPSCQPRAVFFGAGGTLAAGRYDLALYSNAWQPDPADWARFACPDPALAADFTRGGSTIDPAQRRAAYLDAAGRWLDDTCTIPLYEWPSLVLRAGRLNGFEPDPTLGLDTWNAADWSLS